MRCLSVLSVLLVFFAAIAPRSGHAGDQDFVGVWDVNTRLTVASGPVNPTYKPGDLRVDVWQIGGVPAQSWLTTKDGTMQGTIANSQARYIADVPLGQIIVMRVAIGCYLTSSRSMKGTISAEYWDRRFGYKVGLDAWTFEALKR